MICQSLHVPALARLAGGGDEEFRNLKWQVYDRQISQKLFAKIGAESPPADA